jgi:N-acetylglucosaminyldiphosphoundecaprenol N-acetyl-beta-D-mannosaminyltransferase
MDSLLSFLQGRISVKAHTIVVGHNLHSVYLSKIDKAFGSFYSDASVVLCDGFPVFLDAIASDKTLKLDRIGSTDWIPRLGSISATLKVLVIGSTAESNSTFCNIVTSQNPRFHLVGIPGLPFTENLVAQVRSAAQDFKPDLILVGLGMPRQEELVRSASLNKLGAVIACVGGAIDQISGAQKNAPRWLGPLGLEWVWRLAHNPKRLAFRYLVEPLLLLKLIILDRPDA